MTKFKKYLTIGFAIVAVAMSSIACNDPKKSVIDTVSTVQTETQKAACAAAKAAGQPTGTLCK